jgi:hypothetical protein
MYGLLSASTLSVFVSPSALSLLAVNIGVIGFAVRDDWSLATILMSYVAQSVIIGIFQAVKMSDLTVFTTGGYKINHWPVPPTQTVKWIAVLIFVVHYGLFQFGYASVVRILRWPPLLIAALVVTIYVTLCDLPRTLQGFGWVVTFALLVNSLTAVIESVRPTFDWIVKKYNDLLCKLRAWKVPMDNAKRRIQRIFEDGGDSA